MTTKEARDGDSSGQSWAQMLVKGALPPLLGVLFGGAITLAFTSFTEGQRQAEIKLAETFVSFTKGLFKIAPSNDLARAKMAIAVWGSPETIRLIAELDVTECGEEMNKWETSCHDALAKLLAAMRGDIRRSSVDEKDMLSLVQSL